MSEAKPIEATPAALQERIDRLEAAIAARPKSPPKPPRPLLPHWFKVASARTAAKWPLYLFVAGLIASLAFLVPNSAPFYPIIDRICRILVLAMLALLWDLWTRSLHQPEDLDGPAAGAAEYRRIYTIGIFVIGGCLAP